MTLNPSVHELMDENSAAFPVCHSLLPLVVEGFFWIFFGSRCFGY
jgi:hypothetical protein